MKLLSVYLKKLSYCYWSTQVIKRILDVETTPHAIIYDKKN